MLAMFNHSEASALTGWGGGEIGFLAAAPLLSRVRSKAHRGHAMSLGLTRFSWAEVNSLLRQESPNNRHSRLG